MDKHIPLASSQIKKPKSMTLTGDHAAATLLAQPAKTTPELMQAPPLQATSIIPFKGGQGRVVKPFFAWPHTFLGPKNQKAKTLSTRPFQTILTCNELEAVFSPGAVDRLLVPQHPAAHHGPLFPLVVYHAGLWPAGIFQHLARRTKERRQKHPISDPASSIHSCGVFT